MVILQKVERKGTTFRRDGEFLKGVSKQKFLYKLDDGHR